MVRPYDGENEQHRHQAVGGLFNLFTKANHDLTLLHNKLDKEFQQLYPDNANPMKLVARIKKIQEDVSFLNEQCRELLTAKQLCAKWVDYDMDIEEELSFNGILVPPSVVPRKNKLVNFSKDIRKIQVKDLIDKARMVLVGNRSSLQKLQASTGDHVTDDSSDSAYANFNQIIEEWTAQVRSRTGDEKQESGREDINQLLFSAIVPDN